MYLPVLLVRDFGWWAFAVFAVPNAIGAGVMGRVVGSPGRSERIVREHRAACAAFSAVTVAFQMFFWIWLTLSMGETWKIAVGVVALGIVAIIATERRTRIILAVAMALWCVSVGAMTVYVARGGFGAGAALPADPDADLLWLAPVIVFGFALCPYLDLTFHRARQSLDEPAGTRAFALGFGVLFPVMIGFTLLYAAGMAGPRPGLRSAPMAAAVAVAAHIWLQLAFTVGVHVHEIGAAVPRTPARLLLGALVIGTGVGLWSWVAPAYRDMPTAEVVYRCFMGFYGLVFPAYVWICMIPRRAGRTRAPDRRTLNAWLFAVGVAAPMFWMGFVEGRMWWLAPGLAVVLLARLFTRDDRQPAGR